MNYEFPILRCQKFNKIYNYDFNSIISVFLIDKQIMNNLNYIVSKLLVEFKIQNLI